MKRATLAALVLSLLATSCTRVVVAGDIQADVGSQEPATNPVEGLLDLTPHDYIIVPGDVQYENGSLGLLNDHYSETWGEPADKAKTLPTPGNHEHLSTGVGANYCQYFDSGANTNPCVNSTSRPYYAVTRGNWRMLFFDSGRNASGGVANGDDGDVTATQRFWAATDLAQDDHLCELAVVHHPRYNAGSVHSNNDTTGMKKLWELLIDYKVDMVLAGHEHNFQAWERMDENGNQTSAGIRSFVVGTGGKSHHGFASPRPAGLEQEDSRFGFLSLGLEDDGYSWEFAPTTGTVNDQGTEACRS